MREDTHAESLGYVRIVWTCHECGWTFDEVTDTGGPDKCPECGEDESDE